MYTEMTIDQLAAQAKLTTEAARDVVADSRGLRVEFDSSGLWIVSNEPAHPLGAMMNDVARDQLATRFGIPQRYFEKCVRADADNSHGVTGENSLACHNANYWMQQDAKNIMVRTIDPDHIPGNTRGIENATARAILSDRYLRLDNHEVLNAFLQGIGDAPSGSLGRVGALGGGITDKRMYVHLLFEGTKFDLAEPGQPEDPHYLGVCMKNSEVGYGAAGVFAFVYRSYCQNGLVFGKRDLMGFERRHVGQVRGHGELSPETHRKIAEVLISAAADVGRAISDEETRERLIAPLREARRSARVEHPEPAFEELAKSIGLQDAERAQALEHFIREQDYSKFGAAQAVTWLGNDPDRGMERVQWLVEAGGEVINLPSRDWKRVVEAA